MTKASPAREEEAKEVMARASEGSKINQPEASVALQVVTSVHAPREEVTRKPKEAPQSRSAPSRTTAVGDQSRARVIENSRV